MSTTTLRFLVGSVLLTLVACADGGPAGSLQLDAIMEIPGVEDAAVWLDGEEPADSTSRPDGSSGSDTDVEPVVPPAVKVDAASIEFGMVECGGVAPGARTLTIQNTGGSPLAWSATLGGIAFAITGDHAGTLAPNDSVTVGITAPAVPATATAGEQVQDILTIFTNAATNAKVDIPVLLTAAGGTLELAPETVAFGLVPLAGPAAVIPVTLSNTGNQPLKIRIGQAADPRFVLTWDGESEAVELAAGALVPGLTATFSPDVSGAMNAAVTITTEGAVCGASVSSIPMTGEGSIGVVGLSPSELFFGKVDCGATAGPQSVTLTNGGNGSFTFTAALAAGIGSQYEVTPTSGSLVPGASVDLTITSSPIPTTSPVTPDLYADTLILTTTIPGDWAHLIKLHQTAQGAILTLSQSTIDFGNVPIASSANATMSVVNSGNLQASISLVVGNTVFGGTPAGLSPVPAGSALNATLSFLPVVIGAQSGSLELQGDAPDVLCAPLPDTVPLTGTGTNGAVALSASSLNFGLVDCGRTANPQLLVLANTGNGSVTWSTTLGKGSSSPFDVTPTGGIVAPGGTALITVTPVAIPATATTSTDGFGDSLAIVTDVVADSPHVIALHQTARGAVLSFAPAAIDFGLVSLNTTASNPFTIINSGNAPAGVTLAVSGLPIFGVTTPGPITIAGNSSVGDTVTFRPSSVAMYSGSVAMSVGASDVVCAPLAAPLQLQGTGSNGRIAVSPTTMDFGQVPCGTTALPRTITITNSSSTDFTWTGSVSNSHFSLSPSNGFVPAGTSVSVSVIPSAIPVFSTTVWDGYAAWVTITTSINGDGQHIVALHESAFGAIPTVSATSLMFGGVQIGTAANSQFSVGNSGNAPFTMVLQNENPVFSFNPQGLTISGGSGAVVSAQFVPTAAVPYIDEASIQATASSFCGPIPAPISLGGTGTVVGIKVSPNSLNFGLVDCGSTGSAQQFTVYNGSMQTVTWTAVLTAGGSFYQASPSGGSLEANATVIVTVTPMPIPSTSPTLNDAFAGIVTITTNLPDDAPHFVSLHQTAQGAILSFTPSSIDFGSVRIGNSRSAGFKVNNDGNLTANYTLSVSNQNDFSVSPNSNVVAGNTFASEVATFHPSGSGGTGSRIGSVTISSPAALCSPLPHPLQMTGEAF